MRNIKDYNKIHFIGICGVSMKTLAILTKRQGVDVSGSDRNYSPTIDLLKSKNIDAYCGAKIDIVASSQLVVYSSAIKDDDIELKHAKKCNIECIERKDYLEQISKLCKKTVAVAGSHGKTTTTAMICHILQMAQANFTGHIGGDFAGKDYEELCLGDDFFITEACEYRQSFLSLYPYISVVMNCDFDHPDSYENCGKLQQSFEDFCNKASDYCVIGESCREKFVVENGKRVLTFGYKISNDYTAKNLVRESGRYSYDLYKFGNFIGRINLCVYGKFNVLNSLAAICVCDILQVPLATVMNAVNCFFGVTRRFECKGFMNSGARVVIDYAHHPEEIRQSIACAKSICEKKLYVLFEPHTFSRTKALYNEFLTAFDLADIIYLLPTYSAREQPDDGLDSKYLFEGMKKCSLNVGYLTSYDKAVKKIADSCNSDDLVLLLGAGDIYKLAEILLKE